MEILKLHRLPGEIRAMDQGMAFTNKLLMQLGGGSSMVFRNDAAGGVFEYTEGKVRYREVMLTGVVDMQAALTWKNTRSLSFRFLVLTGQEEFVNPRTGEIETDTNAFRYRWTTSGGDVYYTNREDEDPNIFL